MKIKIYLDKGGEWRWSLVSRNGKKVAASGEGYTRKYEVIRAARKFLKAVRIEFNKGLALTLIVSLLALPGCAAVNRNYLYMPSVVQRGITNEKGIVVSDANILNFADDVKLAWQKRMQIAKGIEKGAEGAEVGLGALSGIASVLSFVFPVMGVISIVSSLINKLVGVVGPDTREGAYLDGIKLIDDATAEYYVSQADSIVSAEKRTAGGVKLLQKINAAIYKVESVISGRVPIETALVSAPAQSGDALGGIYSIAPVSKPAQ